MGALGSAATSAGKEKAGGVEDCPSIRSWNVSEVVMSGWLHEAGNLSFGGQ